MKTKKIVTLSIFIFLSIQCSKDDSVAEISQRTVKFKGSWTPFYPELFHDGSPFTGVNFIVYSEKSSQNWREEVAELAEQSLSDIKSRFNLNYEDFDFVGTQSDRKIHILTNYDQWNIALAYRDGIIIRSKDGPNFFGDHETWQKVFQHEITHVIEFLLIGDFSRRNANTVWMREGFGNYGARNHRIKTVGELRLWQEKMKDVPGQGNPINIKGWSDFPQSVIDGGNTGEYYCFFELAVRFLLDDVKGNGTNIDNLKAYYEDLGNGIPHESAFNTHFGLTLNEYQSNYWTMMEEYLKD